MAINADADKLARVFSNILKNAISYSCIDSEIEIVALKENENAIISFSNKGNLIPPESLETIFEKFYRLDVARSSDTGSAGLGLAIAREIAVAHGGTITAKSDQDSTVFTVTIPMHLKND
jgi:two-component system sensor histidine kinase VanS